MNLHDWIDELSDVLEIEDVDVDEGLLADLTKIAATNVEKLAAPVTAFLLGFAAGERGADPEAVERLAARASALAEGWDRPGGAPDPVDVDVAIPDESTVDHLGETWDDERADELVDEEV